MSAKYMGNIYFFFGNKGGLYPFGGEWRSGGPEPPEPLTGRNPALL